MQSEALKNLRDLHLPQQIGAWPLAYGWYIVLAIALFALGIAVLVLYRYFKKNKARKLALKELAQIERDYQNNKDGAAAAYQLTVLLKRVSFAYYPRVKVASLYGEEWQKFLGNTTWSKQLVQLSYQKNNSDSDLGKVFVPIKQWIKACGRREHV